MAAERFATLCALWGAGIAAEASFAAGDPKLQKQLQGALETGIPYVVVLAEDQLDAGVVELKDFTKPKPKEGEAPPERVLVPRGDAVSALRAMGAKTVAVGVGAAAAVAPVASA
jgi:histidyl-tRNA synthetase